MYVPLFPSGLLVNETDNKAASKVPFVGVRFYIHTDNLSDEAFQTIGAKETIEVQWDVAQLHDLSAGGEFNITTEGSLRYAKVGDNKIAGQVVHGSNTIQVNVDGAQAARVHSEHHASEKAKRIVIQSDCSSSQKSVVNAALNIAKSYAQKAQSAASAGTKLQEYFKSTSSSTASTVAGVFSKIANNIVNSGTSGAAKLYCTDVGRWCTDGVVAYTQPGSNEYVSRPVFCHLLRHFFFKACSKYFVPRLFSAPTGSNSQLPAIPATSPTSRTSSSTRQHTWSRLRAPTTCAMATTAA